MNPVLKKSILKKVIWLAVILIVAIISEFKITIQIDENKEFDKIQEIIKKKINMVDQVLEDIEFR